MVGVSFPAGVAGVWGSAVTGSTGSVLAPDRDQCVCSRDEPDRGGEGTVASSLMLPGSRSAKMRAPSWLTVRLSVLEDEWCTRAGWGNLRSLSVAIYTPLCCAPTWLSFTASMSAEFLLLCAFYAKQQEKSAGRDGLPS